MDRKLNVVAFISGGKDSFFSFLHCIANGHKVIALANLYPPDSSNHGEQDSDLNSHMYQTVGHSLIPLYADVLSLPLYRQEIRGTAVNQAKDYHAAEVSEIQEGTTASAAAEDETESMMTLLQRIKRDHPEANAICSGAILSTYQRTRIESVAVRMHLIPLAYLWQYPELPTSGSRKDGLLSDMLAVGLDARIIKVASGGLDEALLWENVCAEATRKRIAKAMKRFGGSVLGEGGEFETLVVDGPWPILKGAIKVREDCRKIIRGGAGEAWMTFAGGAIRKKDGEDTNWLEKPRMPELLDRAFKEVLEILDHQDYHRLSTDAYVSDVQAFSVKARWEDMYHICTGKWTSRISNISAGYVGDDTEAQMAGINHVLLSVLRGVLHRSIHDIVFATILLRSMDDFQAVNQRYAKLFASRPNPPARVTMACGDKLPRGVNVMVSVVVSLDQDALRHCLHVQSRSYWAPANIGPYSQATSVPLNTDSSGALIYIAGQIPLIPASMDIATRALSPKNTTSVARLADFRLQTTLALQHLWRIGKAMSVGWWTGAIAFLVACDDDIRHRAHVAASAWKEIHSQFRSRFQDPATATDDAHFDIWDQQHNGIPNFDTEQEDRILPDFSRLSVVTADSARLQGVTDAIPPLFAVEVAQLPRDSKIEWQALGVSQAPMAFFETVSEHRHSITAYSMASDELVLGFIEIKPTDSMTSIDAQIEQSLLLLQTRCKVTKAVNGHKTIYMSYEFDCNKFKAQVIACKSIWNIHGEKLAAAIVLHHETGDVIRQQDLEMLAILSRRDEGDITL
ncbi:MAG: hypothetical protein Q9225_002016 [Loekoesia sp. 1 TL-2023]